MGRSITDVFETFVFLFIRLNLLKRIEKESVSDLKCFFIHNLKKKVSVLLRSLNVTVLVSFTNQKSEFSRRLAFGR